MLYTESMRKKEIFPYEIEPGAIMDYVDDKFMLVIKDSEWSSEEVRLLDKGAKLQFCYTMDIAIFVFEGGDIDSSDFYFNIQECDQAKALLNAQKLDIEVLLVNQKNQICWKKTKTLDKEKTQKILECLHRQSQISFAPGEFDVNVEGLQSAYEPFELEKYAVVELAF